MTKRQLICVLLAGIATLSAWAGPPRYLDSRFVCIRYHTALQTTVDRVRLWVSTDHGRTWVEQTDVPRDSSSLRYTAPTDGRYDFYVVLENAAGASAPLPTAGAPPHSTVIVDTAAPLLQIRRATLTGAGEKLVLQLKTVFIEENAGRHGVRVFYRSPDAGVWRDGGSVTLDGQTLSWPIPESPAEALDVRLLATDLAGNRAASDICTVQLAGATGPAPAIQRTRATTQPQSTTQPTTSPTSRPAVTVLAPAIQRRINDLKALAQQRSDLGDFDTAAARLREALSLAPRDAELLIALGTTLLHDKDYLTAQRQFEAARAADPESLVALEGLAVAAQMQKRYPEARAHLLRLVQASPVSPMTWLRFGDVEHRLGEIDEAHSAWRRVVALAEPDSDLRRRAEARLAALESVRPPCLTAADR